jgi:hypothetical protein
MGDPENFMEQERAEQREARHRDIGEERQLYDPYTGTWSDRPTRQEAENAKKEDR